jgi:hypothetical protein
VSTPDNPKDAASPDSSENPPSGSPEPSSEEGRGSGSSPRNPHIETLTVWRTNEQFLLAARRILFGMQQERAAKVTKMQFDRLDGTVVTLLGVTAEDVAKMSSLLAQTALREAKHARWVVDSVQECFEVMEGDAKLAADNISGLDGLIYLYPLVERVLSSLDKSQRELVSGLLTGISMAIVEERWVAMREEDGTSYALAE